MSDQTKQEAGEWTAEYVRDLKETRGYITSEEGWQAIADAHNATLGAERDKRSYSRLHVDLAEARAQLAAEREKIYDAVSHEKAVVISEVIKLRSQLAEERDKWKRIWLESDNREAANLREQLDAERDKVETLVDALKQLREQLAVERERCEEPRCDFVSHLQLQKQLATLVDALKEIAKEDTMNEASYVVGVAQMALAKVGK